MLFSKVFLGEKARLKLRSTCVKVLLSQLSFGLMQTWAEFDEGLQYSDPDFKEHFVQRAIFFTTVNPHGELRFL